MSSVTQFYFSNSGEKTNTPGQFKNKLPAPLVLEGEWEAGLKEIHFPNSWWTIFTPIAAWCWAAVEPSEPEPPEGLPPGMPFSTVAWGFEMPRRHYDNEVQLVHDFNLRSATAKREQMGGNEYQEMFRDPTGPLPATKIIMEYAPTENKFSLDSGCKLGGALFKCGSDVLKTLGIDLAAAAPHPVLRKFISFPLRGTKAYTARFGNPGAFLLYWDAIEYSTVGDTSAPLLAVLTPSTAHTNEFTTTISYDRPIFHRLTKSYISEVEFAIHDTTGSLVNFNNLGQTTLVVEYRKVWHQQPSVASERPLEENLG